MCVAGIFIYKETILDIYYLTVCREVGKRGEIDGHLLYMIKLLYKKALYLFNGF